MSNSTKSNSSDRESAFTSSQQAVANTKVNGDEHQDAQTVKVALKTEFTKLKKIKAKDVENLCEAEMLSLAGNRARRKGEVPETSALANSDINRCEAELDRLNTERFSVEKILASTPSHVRKYKNTDRHGIVAPVIFSKAGWVLLTTLIVAITVLGIFLGVEFQLGTASVSASKLALGQTLDGARGLIFPITFGSFVALSFWSYAEEKRLHWASLFLSRLAAAFAFAGIPIVSIIVGSLHTPPGQSWGCTIILMPILTSLLVFSTIGIKYAIVWITKLFYPYKMTGNKEFKKIVRKLSHIKQAVVKAKKDLSNARDLKEKVDSFVDEFIELTRNTWKASQTAQADVAKRKTALRNRLQAEAEEKYLDEE